MVFAHLRREERIGLGIAVVLHLGLAAAFLAQPSKREMLAPAPKMTVNLTTEVGLEATAPDPVPVSAAAIAPTLAPEPAPVSEPVPAPAAQPLPVPPRPRPVERTVARPAPKPSPVVTEPRRRPDAPSRTERSTPKPAGGSRIGADFLPGAGESTTTRETRVPASQIGASAKASIQQALARQVKPHWSAPQGLEVELLVTLLDFDLNPDGSLKGAPRIRSQSGETDANRAQKAVHAERAIRAVRLAAPFDLPPEYYEAWKSVRGAKFDRNLSQ